MAHVWYDFSTPSAAELHLPSDRRGAGFVSILFGEERVTAELSASNVELLLPLNAELLADEKLDPLLRGWRSADHVSALLRYPLEEGSLRHAISQINRKFREAASRVFPGLALPRLISTKRNLGLRLTWPLTVRIPPHPSVT
jgi:hypothetical protein